MDNNRACRSNMNNRILRDIVYCILGAFEGLFAFRLILKLFGANPGNTFVALIYNISGDFLAHFSNSLITTVNNEIEVESVLELTTIIAMIVYGMIAYGVVWLFEIYEIPKDRGMPESK